MKFGDKMKDLEHCPADDQNIAKREGLPLNLPSSHDNFELPLKK